MKNEDNEDAEVDALCRECGHAFKAHIDRIIPPDKNGEKTSRLFARFAGAVIAASENKAERIEKRRNKDGCQQNSLAH